MIKIRTVWFSALLMLATSGLLSSGQSTVPGSALPANKPIVPDNLPFTTQVKKSITFIQTFCLHEPTTDELAAMSPAEKLSWTPEHLAKLTLSERQKMRQDTWSGTGFVVYVPDLRLAGGDRGFSYIVTNRHVAQPGVEHGHPCNVTSYLASLNHLGAKPDDQVYAEATYLAADTFVFPTDQSVDLAVAPVFIDPKEWDFKSVPLALFATEESFKTHKIVEGDPVLFAGLFIQYQGGRRLEPIVRSGSLAMIPTDPITTTLQKPGSVFLADAHVFGGNSGSPMFVDTARFGNLIGINYTLLGVVSGEVFENADLALQVTTSKAVVAANSDISMIVPSFQIRDLLFTPHLQTARDLAVASDPATIAVSKH